MERIDYKVLKTQQEGTEFSAIIGGGKIDYVLIGSHKNYVIAAKRSDCPPFFEVEVVYDWNMLNCQSVDNIFLIGNYEDKVIMEAIKDQLKEIEEQAEFQYR